MRMFGYLQQCVQCRSGADIAGGNRRFHANQGLGDRWQRDATVLCNRGVGHANNVTAASQRRERDIHRKPIIHAVTLRSMHATSDKSRVLPIGDVDSAVLEHRALEPIDQERFSPLEDRAIATHVSPILDNEILVA